jgi:predicted ATPase/class 3 adenylate cyclase
MARTSPPTGTVTFLFTDIEGSTRLWEQDAAGMEVALANHDAILRRAIETHAGHIFKTIGDAFCTAFSTPSDALAQRDLESQTARAGREMRVRMALHTGQPEHRDGDYFGRDLNRVARLVSIGHGGQVLVSGLTHDLIGDQVPTSAGFLDLGEHQLRDLERPERVFQLVHAELSTDFPPLESPEKPRHNLPRRLTRFVGRERAIETVKELVEQHRMVTLTGLGGTGKTRLATRVARGLLDRFEDGVWLVELGAVTDPARVPQAVASAVGIREAGGRPLLETLTSWLRSKHMLLLLDNCEHAAKACADLAALLLHSSPAGTSTARGLGTRILATSRESLGLEGEQVWRVPVLDTPNPDELPSTAVVEAAQAFDAVQLFVDRARLARSDFAVTEANATTVARLCHRLDGIPLAIELAAARMAVLSADEIMDRLDDRFRLLRSRSKTEGARHDTLEATIEWSYELLESDEQALFRSLSVFAGGWTLNAAENVCPPAANVIDSLGALVDKSLVLVEREPAGESRYRMLETTRDYAAQRLAETDKVNAVHDRHLSWFAGLTERAEDGLSGPDSADWMDRLRAENDNLRAALEWSLEHQEWAASAQRMVSTLWRYWRRAGTLTEGIEWATRAVATGSPADLRDRGKALYGLSSLLFFHGALARSREVADQALALGEAENDPVITVRALAAQGRIDVTEGALDTSIERHERALAIARGFDAAWALRAVSLLLGNLAEAYRAQGDLERARSLYLEGLELSRVQGNLTAEDVLHFNLGQTELELGDTEQAREHYREGLSLAVQVGNRLTRMYGLVGLAQVASVGGDCRRAACLFGAAEALREPMGAVLDDVDRDLYDRHVAATKSVLGDELFDAAWAKGRAMNLETASQLALDGS